MDTDSFRPVPEPASVAVFHVQQDGATGSWVGSGSLLDSRVVLLRLPAGDSLVPAAGGSAGDQAGRLRVGVVFQVAGQQAIEVIDVLDIEVVDPAKHGQVGSTFIGLQLARHSAGPTIAASVAVDEADSQVFLPEVRRLVAAVPQSAVTALPGSVERLSQPAYGGLFCSWFGWCNPKPRL